jgi:hypothetical protein
MYRHMWTMGKEDGSRCIPRKSRFLFFLMWTRGFHELVWKKALFLFMILGWSAVSVTCLTAHIYTVCCCCGWLLQMADRCVLMVLFDCSLIDRSSLSCLNHYVLTRNAVGIHCPWLGILHKWKETGCFSW